MLDRFPRLRKLLERPAGFLSGGEAELRLSTGMSILLVEQYVDFAMRLADTYAVMDVGRIVAGGDIATFQHGRVQELLAV